MALTSITSYTDRDVDRDARRRRPDLQHHGRLHRPARERLHAQRAAGRRHARRRSFTQEIRLSGGKDRFQWVGGGFYANTKRDYGQEPAGRRASTDAERHPDRGDCAAPKDVLFFSDLDYKLEPVRRSSARARCPLNDRFSLTGGLRYYHFSEDKHPGLRRHLRPDNNGTAPVAARLHDADGVAPRVIVTFKVSDSTNLNAQVSKGFRLGGINDPLNVPLCTPQDLVTFGGHDTWKDETAWNYEVGSKSRIVGGKRLLQRRRVLHGHQRPAGDGDRGLLLLARRSSTCRSRAASAARSEFAVAPNEHFDFAISGELQRRRAAVHLDLHRRDGRQRRVGHPGGEPPAERARVPDGRRRDLSVARWSGSVAGLPDRDLPARGLALHPGRRPGPRHREPALVRGEHHRRAADATTFTFDPSCPPTTS